MLYMCYMPYMRFCTCGVYKTSDSLHLESRNFRPSGELYSCAFAFQILRILNVFKYLVQWSSLSSMTALIIII